MPGTRKRTSTRNGVQPAAKENERRPRKRTKALSEPCMLRALSNAHVDCASRSHPTTPALELNEFVRQLGLGPAPLSLQTARYSEYSRERAKQKVIWGLLRDQEQVASHDELTSLVQTSLKVDALRSNHKTRRARVASVACEGDPGVLVTDDDWLLFSRSSAVLHAQAHDAHTHQAHAGAACMDQSALKAVANKPARSGAGEEEKAEEQEQEATAMMPGVGEWAGAGAAPALARVLGHPLTFPLVLPLLHLAIFGLLRLAVPLPNSALMLSLPWVVWTFACVLFVGVPLAQMYAHGPTVWIANTVQVDVAAGKGLCSRFLRDPRNLSQYEQKVRGCLFTDPTPKGCVFTIWGAWFGLPFCKSFQLRFTKDGGFNSIAMPVDGGGVPRALRLIGSGGFTVHASEDGSHTKVIHFEKYGWPVTFPLIVLLGSAWRRWHLRGMQVEMELMKAQIETISAALQVARAGDPTTRSPASVYAADYDRTGGSWNGWKYGADDFLKEVMSEAVCAPYVTHHPGLAQ